MILRTRKRSQARWLRYGLRISPCLYETDPNKAAETEREHDLVVNYLDDNPEIMRRWEEREITYTEVLRMARPEEGDDDGRRPEAAGSTNVGTAYRRDAPAGIRRPRPGS